MKSPQQLMGYEIPGDQKASIPIRDWNAMKLALWRSKVSWEIAVRQAHEILGQCKHEEGCPGKDDESAPCKADRYISKKPKRGPTVQVLVAKGCPDRELRMSALVILNAGRQFAPVDARRPADAPYFAPSREYFSEVLASLVAVNEELAVLRAKFNGAGEAPPPPPREPTLASPPARLT